MPDELLVEVRDELIEQFGALTIMPPNSPAEGWWKSGEVLYKDDIVIYRVTTNQDEDEFFTQYKGILAVRFKQEAIWIERLEARPL